MKAAEQGLGVAQFTLATNSVNDAKRLLLRIEIYKWLSLAAAQKVPGSDEALASLESQMSNKDIEKGKRLADAFIPRRTDVRFSVPSPVHPSNEQSKLTW